MPFQVVQVGWFSLILFLSFTETTVEEKVWPQKNWCSVFGRRMSYPSGLTDEDVQKYNDLINGYIGYVCTDLLVVKLCESKPEQLICHVLFFDSSKKN
jgi:hypothetical protein